MIPQDPARPEDRQGHPHGDQHKHRFRAKYFQQYRLFFRFHAQAKVIVYAWVYAEGSQRADDSADDACRVFRRMLDSGRPPSDTGRSCWPKCVPSRGALAGWPQAARARVLDASA